MTEQDDNPEPLLIVRSHRYEQVAKKEFRASIPQHILAKLPDDERFLVETMSKLENQYEWLESVALRSNNDVLNLDARMSTVELANQRNGIAQQNQQVALTEVKERVNTLWDWKQFFSGKWAVLVGLALLIFPILLKALIDWILGKHPVKP